MSITVLFHIVHRVGLKNPYISWASRGQRLCFLSAVSHIATFRRTGHGDSDASACFTTRGPPPALSLYGSCALQHRRCIVGPALVAKAQICQHVCRAQDDQSVGCVTQLCDRELGARWAMQTDTRAAGCKPAQIKFQRP